MVQLDQLLLVLFYIQDILNCINGSEILRSGFVNVAFESDNVLNLKTTK